MLRVQDERHVQRLGHGRAGFTVLVACHQVQQVLRKISTLVLSRREYSGHDSITMRDQQRDLAQQSHGFAEIGLMRSILRVRIAEPQQGNAGS